MQNKQLVIFDFNGVLNSVPLKETLEALFAEYLLSVVSSSPDKYINDYLKENEIIKYFSDILGAETDKRKKVKIEMLLKKYNIYPENAVLITDSLYDVLDANGCGIRSIAVTWGIHGRKELNKVSPTVIVEDPNELQNVIKNVLK